MDRTSELRPIKHPNPKVQSGKWLTPYERYPWKQPEEISDPTLKLITDLISKNLDPSSGISIEAAMASGGQQQPGDLDRSFYNLLLYSDTMPTEQTGFFGLSKHANLEKIFDHKKVIFNTLNRTSVGVYKRFTNVYFDCVCPFIQPEELNSGNLEGEKVGLVLQNTYLEPFLYLSSKKPGLIEGEDPNRVVLNTQTINAAKALEQRLHGEEVCWPITEQEYTKKIVNLQQSLEKWRKKHEQKLSFLNTLLGQVRQLPLP